MCFCSFFFDWNYEIIYSKNGHLWWFTPMYALVRTQNMHETHFYEYLWQYDWKQIAQHKNVENFPKFVKDKNSKSTFNTILNVVDSRFFHFYTFCDGKKVPVRHLKTSTSVTIRSATKKKKVCFGFMNWATKVHVLYIFGTSWSV